MDINAIVAQTQTAVSVEQYLTATYALEVTNDESILTPEFSFSETPGPSPTPTIQQYCADNAMIETGNDLNTIEVSTGSSFQQSWSIKNSGTCIWNSNYSMIFVGGEKFGAPGLVPFPNEIVPESTLQLSLSFTAPQVPGYYEGFWKLQNEKNEQFGLGDSGEVALWVKVNVTGEIQQLPETPTSGVDTRTEPVWIDSFDPESNSFFIGKGNDIGYELLDGKLVITAFHPVGDLWKVARYPEIGTFDLQTINTIGNSCSGKDGYGLIVRAPNQPDNIIDSGYVFGISCDGMFRVYKMENGRYIGILEWTPSEFIRQGPNQTNKLGVKAIGDFLEFYVNDVKIFEFWDSKFPLGLFGIMIRSENTSNLSVYVDEIAYWTVSQ